MYFTFPIILAQIRNALYIDSIFYEKIFSLSRRITFPIYTFINFCDDFAFHLLHSLQRLNVQLLYAIILIVEWSTIGGKTWIIATICI